MITDDQNNVYVGTTTFSSNFPVTPNAFQTTFGGNQEGVVFKLDYALSTMIFSSFIGGSGDDAVFSIDVDTSYNLYVTGGTISENFPVTTNAYDTIFDGGATDGFLALVSYDGSDLLASTYFGSNKFAKKSCNLLIDKTPCSVGLIFFSTISIYLLDFSFEIV